MPCVVLLLMVSVAACGKMGPPQAPFLRVPDKIDGVSALRIEDDVHVSLSIPSKNADGQAPADIDRVEVFAVTAARAPETDTDRKAASLVGTLPVRPWLPPASAAQATEALPVMLPGYDQGGTAVFRERITATLMVPVDLPGTRRPAARPPAIEAEPVPGPLVAPAPTSLVRRFYFVVGVSPRGRRGQPTAAVGVPFGEMSAAPGTPEVTYTETDMTIIWTPSPDARVATLQAQDKKDHKPPPVGPAELQPLEARSLGFTTQATAYHVYEVPAQPAPADSFPTASPQPLTEEPIEQWEWSIASITYGKERCFVVRSVDRVSGVMFQGPASPQTCVTPRDMFPPAAPQSLAAIGGAGVINLIWEANEEPDLAGYLVLRGEAPGDRLQALTPVPVRETTFRDATVSPGVRYVYVVVAVDTADPPNVSPRSNRAEEIARQ